MSPVEARVAVRRGADAGADMRDFDDDDDDSPAYYAESAAAVDGGDSDDDAMAWAAEGWELDSDPESDADA